MSLLVDGLSLERSYVVEYFVIISFVEWPLYTSPWQSA